MKCVEKEKGGYKSVLQVLVLQSVVRVECALLLCVYEMTICVVCSSGVKKQTCLDHSWLHRGYFHVSLPSPGVALIKCDKRARFYGNKEIIDGRRGA